jgi:hypothetical protein
LRGGIISFPASLQIVLVEAIGHLRVGRGRVHRDTQPHVCGFTTVCGHTATHMDTWHCTKIHMKLIYTDPKLVLHCGSQGRTRSCAVAHSEESEPVL